MTREEMIIILDSTWEKLEPIEKDTILRLMTFRIVWVVVPSMASLVVGLVVGWLVL